MNELDEISIGAAIATSGLFDCDYYLATNPDVAASGIDPIVHYIRHGEKEGRRPSANFDLQRFKQKLDGEGNILFQYICHLAGQTAKKQDIPVVFACDNAYAPYLGVALASLARNRGINREYSVFVLYMDLAEEARARLEAMAGENMHINFIYVKDRIPAELKQAHISGHITQVAYVRLAIPEIFPHYRKILYLDCDLIINRDLADIYSLDLEDAACGAIQEIFFDTPYYRRLRESLPDEVTTYFNSGVILFDTVNYHKHNIYKKCCEIAQTGREFICHDQDIMNIACHKLIKPVEYTWNFQWIVFVYGNHRFMTTDDFRMYATYFGRPAIVHFTSDKKPVNFDDKHFANMFWDYARDSPYYKELLEKRSY